MWAWAEWLVYQRHKGTKWLADILSTYKEQMWDSSLAEKIKYPGQRLYQYLTTGLRATAVTSSRIVTAARDRSRLRHLEKQNPVLPTSMGDKIFIGLSGFVNKTKTAIKNAILDHVSEISTSDSAWEMEISDPVVIMDEAARAPWFWSCGPNEQSVCLMLKIPKAHEDMIKCVSISPLCFSFIFDTF